MAVQRDQIAYLTRLGVPDEQIYRSVNCALVTWQTNRNISNKDPEPSRIADEVIAHLSGLVGANVKVTLEVEAEIPSGAPDQVVRTVTENSRTLKFTSQGFEAAPVKGELLWRTYSPKKNSFR